MIFNGRDLLKMSGGDAKVRGNWIAMIFQEPMTSLNPVLTIGRQMAEPWKCTADRPRKRPWKRRWNY